MCGIVGFSGFKDDSLISEMCKSLNHRGPDFSSYLSTENISIGHTRLAIIDLNKAANQPMANSDNSLFIVFNGEIYNFKEIKSDLIKNNHFFRTNSDTEVILKAYEEWGEDCVERFNGMFAFAIYDKINDHIFLARDRVGIKPIYYLQIDNKFIFSSEIKSILKYGKYERSINQDAIGSYLQFRYTISNNTLFDGIKKFPAGHYGIVKNSQLNIFKYWQLPNKENYEIKNKEYYSEKFSYLLEDSVNLRMNSDVPFGMYLGGGIDSTVILSIINKLSNNPINTYSIDFNPSSGESLAASKIASEFSSNHNNIIVQDKDLEMLPEIINHFDEPHGGAIALPMYKLSKEASKDVKMVLTGEGADEILAGYQYFKSVHYAHKINPFLFLINRLLWVTPNFVINWLSNHPGKFRKKSKQRLLDLFLNKNLNYIEKLKSLMTLFTKKEVDELLCIHYNDNVEMEKQYSLTNMQKYIFNDWLPNNILLRQDKMTMASSIEGRVPFLDHRLVEFSFNMPDHYKINMFSDKQILRKYCHSNIPAYNSKTRKKPFYIPLNHYIKTDIFQDFLLTYFNKEDIENGGLFNYRMVKNIIDNSYKTDFLYANQLFSILMFQMWKKFHF